VRTLLEQGAHVTGSPAAQELEWLILQRRNVRSMRLFRRRSTPALV